MDDLTVGVIGLGIMGRAITSRLLATGADTTAFDVDPSARTWLEARGGRWAPSVADAARAQPVVVVIVHDERQVDAVLFGDDADRAGGVVGGVAAAASPGTVIWLVSTVSPWFVRSVADRLLRVGVGLVDGPVSGGPDRAARGELSVFVGGSAPDVERASAVLSRCATQRFAAGAAGDGATLKLVNQILTAANIALTAEAVAIGTRAGLDADRLIDAISHSAGTSRQFERRAARMATGDHRVDATVRTFLKDLSIALEMAHDLGVSAPMAEAARGVFAAAGDLGLLDRSDTMLVEAYRRAPVQPATSFPDGVLPL